MSPRSLLRGRFDAVIHFAGLKAVGESVRLPLKYYRNNIQGTFNLAEMMEKHGCKKVGSSFWSTAVARLNGPMYQVECARLNVRNNIQGTFNLAERMEKHGCKKVCLTCCSLGRGTH